MASRISTGANGAAMAATNVTSGGSGSAGAVLVSFNDSDALDVIITNLRKAEGAIIAWDAKGRP